MEFDNQVERQSEIYEEVELPSRGFRENGENLPSTLHLRSMKMGEEELAFSGALKSSKLISEILERCTKEKIDASSLYENDRSYLLYMLRAITYGSTYHISTKCKSCEKRYEVEIDLKDLEVKQLESEEDLLSTITLPVSGKVVTLRHLIGQDIDALSKTIKNTSTSLRDSLAIRIADISGEDKSIAVYKRILSNLHGRDSAALRKAAHNMGFGLQQEIVEECTFCGEENKLSLEVTEDFFRPRD